MERFSVKLSGLQQRIGEEKSICTKLLELKNDINQVSSTLSFQIKSKQNIQKVINQLAEDVDNSRCDMRLMQNVLENIRMQYRNTENQLCDKNAIISNIQEWVENIGVNIASNATEKTESTSPNWWKLLWNTTGKFGLGGAGVSAIGNIITGDKSKLATWGGLLKSANDGYKAYKKIDWSKAPWKKATATKGSTAEWWKSVFGLNKGEIFTGASELKTGGKLVGWSGAKAGWSGGLEKSMQSVTPATVIVSGVVSTLSNIDEHKDAFNNASTDEERFEVVERATQEVILETAIDVGKGVLVGAAVTAGLAAVGVASAPVVVVGAISAGVCWGADVLCQELTGKPVTELISDTILDTKEAVEDFAKDVISKGAEKVEDFAKDVIGKGAEKVKEGASALWSGVKSKFSFGW